MALVFKNVSFCLQFLAIQTQWQWQYTQLQKLAKFVFIPSEPPSYNKSQEEEMKRRNNRKKGFNLHLFHYLQKETALMSISPFFNLNSFFSCILF